MIFSTSMILALVLIATIALCFVVAENRMKRFILQLRSRPSENHGTHGSSRRLQPDNALLPPRTCSSREGYLC